MQINLSPFDLAAALIVLAAGFSYINSRFIRLPTTIGMMVLGLLVSASVVALGRLFPQAGIVEAARRIVEAIDFRTTLLDGMLSFLLFAGALQVDVRAMHESRLAILALSTFGTLLSTMIVGLAAYGFLGAAGAGAPLLWCLVFGALISPTDPIAVIAVLRSVALPRTIQATVAAESLFNDGVGVVVFSILCAAVAGGAPVPVGKAVGLFIVEAGGGVALGVAFGMLAVRALSRLDDRVTEILITLAVVMGGYAITRACHASGPIAMAVAGLVVGARDPVEAPEGSVAHFWELIDDILNVVLFMLIGLEALVVWSGGRVVLPALAAIPIVLAARLASVALPLILLRPFQTIGRGAFPILWWGGLRGGISIALALSIPAGPHTEVILAATYAVVFFSVVVQGTTIDRVARRYRST